MTTVSAAIEITSRGGWVKESEKMTRMRFCASVLNCNSASQLIAGDPYAQLNFDSLTAFSLIKVGVAL